MNYLDSNLVTLNTNLFRSNFDRILDSIWVEVLEEMRDVLDNEDVVSNNAIQLQRINGVIMMN
jgi:BAI1-associated protein 3